MKSSSSRREEDTRNVIKGEQYSGERTTEQWYHCRSIRLRNNWITKESLLNYSSFPLSLDVCSRSLSLPLAPSQSYATPCRIVENISALVKRLQLIGFVSSVHFHVRLINIITNDRVHYVLSHRDVLSFKSDVCTVW